ncbi:serine phosphatase RsbU (regulator of sigma subunit)/anti-sigma regulatory factor (Ser/Thr protein kinase) [Streptosporangium becharense]|uniref:protein-serine/threonine phosphatase n=1 Tax=Streptosporangium becharense TaxID=1816182 RepID=A0A7W9IKZ3_9ACTN|nr:SpoIIE family protein phosphatase [Streptosporangium becharense]MBB2910903.1 serine phosphatase RsbU (regulator of sigma subunit)/anti-sigma regulatory factor (Ser/Thr protein kinase) [Streptosporangium becharense]MBB5822038.1 serine phosphatase RsbU (regulator of sigma subunit)/anti-sigma regulatory factor (Ser/Thr protein kinase) [Streptosporangium becharense]
MKSRFVTKDPAAPSIRMGSPASMHEQLSLLNAASKRIGSTLDMFETGRELMDVAVPRFADAAGILVQDRLVTEGEFPHQTTDGSALVRRIAVGVSDPSPDVYAEAFPVDEVVSYAPWTPYARCMATGNPILYPRLGRRTAEEIGRFWKRSSVSRVLEDSSFLVVPLKARGRVLGFVIFTRRPTSQPFDDHDVNLAEELAARTAVCLDNARLYSRERRTALTLQSSLLPVDLSQPLGLTIASRYLPASDLVGVGGDWYDVIQLPGCRVALVVGDVMGHGIRAAATMGQLRTAARTLASLDLSPADVLFRLNLMSQDLDASQIATCVYATYDPVTRRCAIASAGHVPPILVRPGGETELLEVPPGLPLGIGSEPIEMREFTLPHGTVLAFYTDGLVESRDRDIEEGIGALRGLLSGQDRDLEEACDLTIGAQRPGHERDDIALLLARVNELSDNEIAEVSLPADRRSVSQARRFTRATLGEWGLSSLCDNTELMVSELVTNAIEHGGGEVELRLLRGPALVCEVSDTSASAPVMREMSSTSDTGRGLHLINWLAHRWGSRTTPKGKIVWIEQRLP